MYSLVSYPFDLLFKMDISLHFIDIFFYRETTKGIHTKGSKKALRTTQMLLVLLFIKGKKFWI